MWFPLLVAVALSCHCSHAAPKEDLVTNLPGLSKQPPFKQYSGYLKGDHVGDKHLHYWFVESSSNAATDPVVLWLNGGPGCSSDLGFLTEHGPFQIQPDGKTLSYNPFAWNQVANMIYLESPVGVGYSYSDSRDYATNDSAVAIQNAIALQDFFDKFPEYKNNEFYITGESYGGIYVPTLTAQVLKIPTIKLKGFAVGNGLSSSDDNENSLIYFIYFHGLIGDDTWNDLNSKCCQHNKSNRCNFAEAARYIDYCDALVKSVAAIAWSSGLDVYNLYAECAGGVNTGFSAVYQPQEDKYTTTYFGWPYSHLKDVQAEREKMKLIPRDKLQLAIPCSNLSSSIMYMNQPDVRKALHIPPHLAKWEPCSVIVSMQYQTIYSTMKPFYELAMAHKLRIMVYNGDVDMACNFLGDEWFVDNLPLKNPSNRQMWYYKAADGTRQVAGFFKAFDNNIMTLVTVKGSGHMVPTDKPRPALEAFINFIQNKSFE